MIHQKNLVKSHNKLHKKKLKELNKTKTINYFQLITLKIGIKHLASFNLFRLFKRKSNKWKVIKEAIISFLLGRRDKIIYIIKNPNHNIRRIDKNVRGYLGINEAKVLYDYAKKINNNSVIVEIGAYLGRSTCFISEAIKKKKKITFFSIDTFQNQAMSEGLKNTYKEYLKNIFRYKYKIKTIRGFSYNVVKSLQYIKIDLLWIDADHSYTACKKDIEDWYPLVKENGYIIFHDYAKGFINDVRRVVDEKIDQKQIKKIKLENCLLVTQKI